MIRKSEPGKTELRARHHDNSLVLKRKTISVKNCRRYARISAANQETKWLASAAVIYSLIVEEILLNLRRCFPRLPNIYIKSSAAQAKNRPSMAGRVAFAAIGVIAVPHLALAAVHASIVVEARTGKILYAHNAESLAHPASLTKLMTLFITFGRLESGRMKLSEKLPVSRHAAAQQPTKLWLRPGSEFSVRSAILGITTRSANDAAVVLAEAIAGSESQFARQMTKTARKLGMKRTRFYNASGLPDRRQWTTAHDMARLAIALIRDYPQYYRFFSVRSFEFHGHVIYGHDHVLDEFTGADGLKTGYIRASGYNLVTSAVRGKRRLVGVVLGGRTARARDRRMIALLNRGFHMAPGIQVAAGRLPDTSAARPAARPAAAAAKFVKAAAETAGADETETRDCVIEIGGDFSTQQAVRRVLRSAMRTAPGLLTPRTELVVKLRGRHFRARFRRLDAGEAIQACRSLHHKGFTCRIVRMPVRQDDLAGNSTPDRTQAD